MQPDAVSPTALLIPTTIQLGCFTGDGIFTGELICAACNGIFLNLSEQDNKPMQTDGSLAAPLINPIVWKTKAVVATAMPSRAGRRVF